MTSLGNYVLPKKYDRMLREYRELKQELDQPINNPYADQYE